MKALKYLTVCAIVFCLSILCFGPIFALGEEPAFAAIEESWADTETSSVEEKGVGTKESPYEISNVLELLYFLRDKEDAEAGAYYIQTADIHLENKWWTSVGTSSKPFSGIYNGNGFSFVRPSMKSGQGFFGHLSGATIMNLQISGLTYDIDNTGSLTTSIVGGIAGYADSSTISNCQVVTAVILSEEIPVTVGSILVRGKEKISVGGIVGILENGSKVTNSFSNVSISVEQNTLSTDYTSVGGIVGEIRYGRIQNCISSASISLVLREDSNSGIRVGGLVGYVENRYSRILNNVYYGSINSGVSTSMAVGSAVGFASDTSVNYNKVYASSLSMPIIGKEVDMSLEQKDNNSTVSDLDRVRSRSFYAPEDLENSEKWDVTSEWDFDLTWDTTDGGFPSLQVFRSYTYTVSGIPEYIVVRVVKKSGDSFENAPLLNSLSQNRYSIKYGTEFFIIACIEKVEDMDYSRFFKINGLIYGDKKLDSKETEESEIEIDEKTYISYKRVANASSDGGYGLSVVSVSTTNNIIAEKFNKGTTENPDYESAGEVKKDGASEQKESIEQPMMYDSHFSFQAMAKVGYAFSHWKIIYIGAGESGEDVIVEPNVENVEHVSLFSSIINGTYGRGLFYRQFDLIAVFSNNTASLKLNFESEGATIKINGTEVGNEVAFRFAKRSVLRIEITVQEGYYFNPDKFAIEIFRLMGGSGDNYDEDIFNIESLDCYYEDEDGLKIYKFSFYTARVDNLPDDVNFNVLLTTTPDDEGVEAWVIIVSCIGGVILLGGIAFLLYFFIKRRGGGGGGVDYSKMYY